MSLIFQLWVEIVNDEKFKTTVLGSSQLDEDSVVHKFLPELIVEKIVKENKCMLFCICHP
jgi:hypothetical protein